MFLNSRLISAQRFKLGRWVKKPERSYHEGSLDNGNSRVKIPMRKSWPKGAVLQALSEETTLDPLKNTRNALQSADFAPAYRRQKLAVSASIDQGRETLEQIKRLDPQYFSLDWIESIMPKTANSTNLLPVTETGTASNEPSPAALEMHISCGDVNAVCNVYRKLVERNIQISSDTAERFAGFLSLKICEHLYTDTVLNKKDLFEQIEILRLLVENVEKPTLHLFSVLLRCYAKLHRGKNISHCYNQMRKSGFFPDLETVNAIMFASRDSPSKTSLAKDLVQEMVRRKVEPTIETYMGYLLCQQFSSQHTSKQILDTFGRFVKDMEYQGFDSNADIYFAMLKIASMNLWNLDVVCTILNVLEEKNLPVLSSLTTLQLVSPVMRFAFETDNLTLAKRVWRLMLQDQFRHLLLDVNAKPDFYWLYLNTVCKNDTMENIAKALVSFRPERSPNIQVLFHALLSKCIKDECAGILPYLFSEIALQRDKEQELLLPWLNAAVLLSDKADEDTKTQLKNISFALLDLVKKQDIGPPDAYLDSLCLLVAVSDDEVAIKDFLLTLEQSFPSIKLSDATLEQCALALRASPDFISKFCVHAPVSENKAD